MPVYAFVCGKCDHNFDVLTSYSNKKHIACPSCGSQEIKETFRGYGSGVQASSGGKKPFT